MPRPASKPSGLTKAPRKEHPVAPDPAPAAAPAPKTDGKYDKVGEGNTRLSTVIPADLHKRLKIAAAVHDLSIQEAVTEAIEGWLDQQ